MAGAFSSAFSSAFDVGGGGGGGALLLRLMTEVAMLRQIRAGTTDVSVVIRIVDSTTGAPETGVEHNSAGIDLWYRREGTASTDITEAALSALTDAHSDGGIEHINDGYYRLDLPDAACASGATGVQVGGVVDGMVVIGCYVELIAYNPYDTVRLGLTALPNAAADAAGGLPISDAGGLDLDAKVGALTYGTANRVNVQVYGMEAGTVTATAIATNAIDADAIAADAIAEINATVDTALADYDAPTKAELDNAEANIIHRLRGLVMEQVAIGDTGNDATHLHVNLWGYGDDEINDHLLVVYDDSEGEWHARWITDWANATRLVTVATLPFTPESNVDQVWLLSIRQDVTGGSGLDAAGVRAAVGLASANLDAQLGAIDTAADDALARLTGTGAVTFASFTVSGTTTLTGAVAANAGVTFTSSTGDGFVCSSTGGNGDGLRALGHGTGDGFHVQGGVTGNGAHWIGGGTSGAGLSILTTDGHGVSIAATGANKHGLLVSGGNSGTCDGTQINAGTGGVDLRADLVGSITGNLSGSVGSVSGAVGSVTGAVGSVTGNVGGNVTGTVGGFTTAAKAEIQQEAEDALAAYDPPTNAEMEARTLAAASYATAANLATVAGYLDTEIAAILADTNELQTDWANGGRLDLLIDAILDDTGTAGVVVASGSKTGYSLAAAGLDSVTVETGLNARQALSIIASASAGVLDGAATTTVTIAGAGVATNRITATVTSDGNRTAVVLSAPA